MTSHNCGVPNHGRVTHVRCWCLFRANSPKVSQCTISPSRPNYLPDFSRATLQGRAELKRSQLPKPNDLPHLISAVLSLSILRLAGDFRTARQPVTDRTSSDEWHGLLVDRLGRRHFA